MNRDIITDDGINYRGKERSIILGWRSETKRKVGDNRGQTLQIPVDEIDRVFQAGFTDLPPIQSAIVFHPISFGISLVEFHDVVALIILSGSDRSE